MSYLSPKTEVRESKIHGRGLFATADIAKDEIVAVKGGHIVDRKTLRERITPRLGPVEIQIDDDLFIAPVTDEERELSMLYSNHSCNANLGMRGEITFVAVRVIRAGEELTHDWAMTDDDGRRTGGEGVGAREDVFNQRLTGHPVQHFGQRGLHAGAFAGREDDDVGVHVVIIAPNGS